MSIKQLLERMYQVEEKQYNGTADAYFKQEEPKIFTMEELLNKVEKQTKGEQQ